ncbi:MAG TPA: cytochrome b/b6 domain-containing protein [Stellaceae bacterium]|nr:cytochrome b/b6 domain-containing protein [Stellaceae bacterium]
MTAPAARLDPIDIHTYGLVARVVHWLVAVLAVVVVGLGWSILGSARETGWRDLLLLLHRSFGLLVLALMVFRIIWRLSHPPPPLPTDFPRFEALAAHADHALLYLMFIVMPLSGYANAALSGHLVNLFGIIAIPPLLPESGRLSQIAVAVHLAGQFLIYMLVGVHVAAALVHRYVRGNAILDRMLPRRRTR